MGRNGCVCSEIAATTVGSSGEIRAGAVMRGESFVLSIVAVIALATAAQGLTLDEIKARLEAAGYP